MSNKQRVLLVVFLGMFLVPELLWGSVLNYLSAFIQSNNVPFLVRQSSLIESGRMGLISFVILIQAVGLLMSIILVLKRNIFRSKVTKSIVLFFLISLFLIASFESIVVFLLRNASFP